MLVESISADEADIDYLAELSREARLQQAFEWLAGWSGRRQQLAAGVLAVMGRSVLPELTYMLAVSEPDLQERILDIIGEIGGRPSPELFVVLYALARCGDPWVADKITELAEQLKCTAR